MPRMLSYKEKQENEHQKSQDNSYLFQGVGKRTVIRRKHDGGLPWQSRG